MKTARPCPAFTVTPKAEVALLRGSPWVYDTEILSGPAVGDRPSGSGRIPADTAPGDRSTADSGQTVSTAPPVGGSQLAPTAPSTGENQSAVPLENGSIVDVVSKKGRYLGSALYSQHSKLRLRLLTRNANDRFDDAFWERKLRWAWAYRKTVLDLAELDACRVVFGEADGFPGLTVDRFHDLLSVQILSYGMDRLRDTLLPLLVQILREDGQTVRGVYLRNDSSLRDKEGLPRETGWYVLPNEPTPASPVTEITENGIRYLVDVEHGQKTGFFLDQKRNRQAVARLAAGKTVLDCFTHTGSFALNAARGGAAKVTAADVSESAVSMARENAARNGYGDIVECVQADVFDLLPRLEREGARYDLIILDPPAFAKSRRAADAALAGYKEINLRAMRLLPRGGYLATCSCSRFATPEKFSAMLRTAARDAHVQLRLIEERRQSPDHPILWGAEDTEYLKFYLFQVV